MKSINTIVIPIAGAGTRLYPITHITPKEMLRLVDKPILYYLLQEAYEANIRHVVLIVHSNKKSTKKFIMSDIAPSVFHDNFPGLKFSFIETKKRFGDGQAIYEARHVLKKEKAFGVTMGDLLSLPGKSIINELKEVYVKHNVPVISVEKVEREKTRLYGVIDPLKSRRRIHHVRSIVEKPEPKDAPSEYVMTGKYILTPAIFDYIEKLVKNRKEGKEVRLADALNDFAHDHPLYAYSCKNKYFDTGNKLDLLKTEIIFALANKEFGHQIKSALNKIIKE